ncbi:hypothetical protein EHQ52_02525 [Leptospira koniambonensis]|uniref:Uncharacterized protein n=1 Tax=Leptospira koniambonensis TaxID=2484950 RepID=A0A4R9JBE1_9LEPT|nr:hypothetical protein [Leptospira koniambonensis]TGL36771.1 hypothetical protein EHQ52_02525 [Leptospira koniambonensis]
MGQKIFPSFKRVLIYFKLFLLPSGFLFSQQDLFNVPDMKITGKDRNFVQEQVIFYSDRTQFDTTYMYGLGDNQEIGLYAGNYFLQTYSPQTGNYPTTNILYPEAYVSPNLLLIYQKKIEASESLAFSFGTKSGVSLGQTVSDSSFASFNFGMGSYELKSLGAKFYLGAYMGNNAFFGRYKQKLLPSPEPGVQLSGFMYGLSVEIIPNRLDFLCDSISGVNSLGVSVCGFSHNLSEEYSISFGYQIPNYRGSNFNPHAFLIELNGYF